MQPKPYGPSIVQCRSDIPIQRGHRTVLLIPKFGTEYLLPVGREVMYRPLGNDDAEFTPYPWQHVVYLGFRCEVHDETAVHAHPLYTDKAEAVVGDTHGHTTGIFVEHRGRLGLRVDESGIVRLQYRVVLRVLLLRNVVT